MIYSRLRSISTYYILLTSPQKAKHVVKYDSGVRGAADVFERVGARGQVLCLWVWGLSIISEHGVRHVMKGLLADLDILMNVAGCQSIDRPDSSGLVGKRVVDTGKEQVVSSSCEE